MPLSEFAGRRCGQCYFLVREVPHEMAGMVRAPRVPGELDLDDTAEGRRLYAERMRERAVAELIEKPDARRMNCAVAGAWAALPCGNE